MVFLCSKNNATNVDPNTDSKALCKHPSMNLKLNRHYSNSLNTEKSQRSRIKAITWNI